MKIVKPKFLFVFTIILCSIVYCEEREIVIVHTTDIHGFLVAPPEFDNENVIQKNRPGGLQYVAGLIESIREEAKKNNAIFLLFDSGDIFSGTPEGDKKYNIAHGESMINFMNLLQYDATTIGNHEFAYGVENLRKLTEIAKFPFLCGNANFISKKNPDGTPQEVDFAKPYIIKIYENIKIAIIGVAHPDTAQLNLPEHVKDIDFIPVKRRLNFLLEKIVAMENPDIIILLYHNGLDDVEDLLKLTANNKIPELVDVVLAGHSHEVLLQGKIRGKTAISLSGAYGQYVGKLNLTFDTEKRQIVKRKVEAIEVNSSLKPSEKIVKEFLPRYLLKDFDKVIGVIQVKANKSLKYNPSLLIAIAKILKKKNGVDFSVISLPSIRFLLPNGQFTARDLYNCVPFQDPVSKFTLTGEEVKEVVSAFLFDARKDVYCIYGVTFDVDNENKTVKNLKIDGKDISAGEKYTFCVNSFGIRYLNLTNQEKLFAHPTRKELNSVFTTIKSFVQESKGIPEEYFKK